MTLTPGTRLAQYEIHTFLGAGGMGEVYLARDTKLDRPVALKLLSLTSPNGQVASAFEDEARMASALNHPNLLTIYEIGRTVSASFIASEFVEGETIRALLSSGPLPLDQVLEIALQVSSALARAHLKGLIHCDLKPENIMVRPDGVVKVLDFGLAHRAAQRHQAEPLNGPTQEPQGKHLHSIDGTIGYIAPELLAGFAPDARADLWSLGVLLFEMIGGRRPFARATGNDELRAIRHEEPPVLSSLRPEIPLNLESVVNRALAKNPTDRYQSANDVIQDLARLKEQLQLPRARSMVPASAAEVAEARSLRETESSLDLRVTKRFLFHQSHRRWLQALLRQRRPNVLMVQPQGVAFRGLLPFQEADREHFYGRDLDTHALYAMVTHQAFRFGVLFGDSGCGKTSLMRAGLIPRLWEEGYVPLYCRSFSDPLAAVVEECRKRSRLEIKTGESPIDYLYRASRALDATLVVICDQFEEFFVNLKSATERAPFVEFVVACHTDSSLPVKLLFSMRSDFLYLINAEFSERISEPLLSSKLYHLRNFNEEVAEEILERSVRSAALPFEPGLSRQIALDLAVNHQVTPSEMQIVGTQLQARRIFTFDVYQLSGGKEALVHEFLEDVIKASGEGDSARLLLRSLISDENTRLTLSIAEICNRTQRSREIISQLLQQFANARLVRELQEQDPWRYELMHEYLIDKINSVTGQVLDATQRANRQFRQYLASYSLDRRTRIPLTSLWSIRRYSDLPLGKRERELLQKSARAGLLRTGLLVLLLAVGATAVAAYFSRSERWPSLRLSDGHTASARHVVFSPDGQRLVSCGEDGQVIVWDFSTRQRIAALTDHQGWVNWVDYSPDGKWFATASQDQTVIVWDAEKLQKATVLNEHRSGVSTISFSPNGRWLVSASADNDNRTILWDVNGWRKVREVYHGIKWGQLLFTPDSRAIIAPGGATWDIATGHEFTNLIPDVGNYGSLDAAGLNFITIDGAGHVALTDLAQRKVLFRTRGHQFHGRVAIFSPDARLWATASEDIVLWDAATQTKLVRLPYVAEVWSLVFSRDGKWLVASYTDGAILLWDVKERAAAASFSEHSDSVRAVAFSPDGQWLASASEDKSIVVWDVAQRRKKANLFGHHTRVTGVAFAPDGKWLVSVDQDGRTIRWDSSSGRIVWEFTRQPVAFPGYSIAVSPDGRWIASSNGVNDSASGRSVADFFGTVWGQLYGLAFTPDGSKLLGVTPPGFVVAWEAGSWRVVHETRFKEAQLICIKFTPDGRHFVTGEDEGVLRLWETDGLRQVTVIGRHTARIKAIDFSPDGSELVSAGDDQTISLWNVGRRRLIANLGTHTAPVLAVDFAPDGKRIASGGQDNSVYIYSRERSLWGYRLN